MELRLRVHLQQQASGRFAARVPDMPWIIARAAGRDEAIAAVRAQVAGFLASGHAGDWSEHPFHEHQWLVALALQLKPKGSVGGAAVAVTVSLVVTRVESVETVVFRIVVPAARGLEIVVGEESQIAERAGAALAKRARKWATAGVLGLDQGTGASLDVLSVGLPDPVGSGSGGDEADRPSARDSEEDDVLRACGVELTEATALERLARADEREEIVARALAALAGERRSSVLLVGPADVGKTAITHEIARRVGERRAPPALLGRAVWSVAADDLMAGMAYMGEWQERVALLVQQARRQRPILAMGDPEALVDAGRWSRGDNNMARYLRPHIEAGELSVICECTPERLAACMTREPSFVHAFERIDVPEPEPASRSAILAAAAARLEHAEGVVVAPDALEAAIDLTRRFLPDRAFPGKALRLLERSVRDPPGEVAEPGTGLDRRRILDRAAVTAAFTRQSGLPEAILSDERELPVAEVRDYVEARLHGQPEAVDALVDLVTVVKAGLDDPRKPLGSLFLVGPTGVGKTEAAKVLAELLFGSRERLVRLDMGEYAGGDALTRMIGAAWGDHAEGELTRRVREQPFCVLLLDEIEKAHTAVFDALLAVLGEGRLTDPRGRTADFRNAIVVMTSNLGAGRREAGGVGFGAGAGGDADGASLDAHYVGQAERFFRPEFVNRIDRIVAFRALSRDAMRLIARRDLDALLSREGVTRRALLVEVDDAVIEALLDRGFHPRYGVRPLQREIERAVIVPLARLLVDRRPDPGALVRVRMHDGLIEPRLVPAQREEPSPQAPEPALAGRDGAGLRAALEAAAGVREAVASLAEGTAARRVREDVSTLLARSAGPLFWDDPESARATLGRIYDLERLVGRLDRVIQRSQGVEEWAGELRRHRDRRRLPELAGAVAQIGHEAGYLSRELGEASVGGGPERVTLRVVPLGPEAGAWAAEVAAMYLAWAIRRDLQAASAEHDGRVAVEIEGPALRAILRGESGLHRLAGPGRDRGATVCRVALAGQEGPEADGVARVYRRGGRGRDVRDPRTGVRRPDPDAVLGGAIDAFLLAHPAPE